MKAEHIARAKDLSGQIATELAFVEAGKDNGLLPLNCLLGELEQLASDPETVEAITKAVSAARRWVDEIFETTGTFSAAAIGRLREWGEWLQNAVQALERQGAVPAVPAAWGQVLSAAAPEAPASLPAQAAAPANVHPSEPETAITLNLADDAELLREFTNESQEHLTNIEQGVLVLEDNPTDADTLNAIFRAFHTLKGGSGFLHLSAMQTLAHELESLLDLARQHKLEINLAVINLILEGGDTLKQFLTEIGAQVNGKKPVAPISIPTQQLLARVRAVVQGKPQPEPARGKTAPMEVAPRATTPAITQSAIPAGASPAPAATPAPASTPAPAPRAGSSPPAKSSGPAVKVDTLKLDGLVDLVGELVIAQSLVMQNRVLSELKDQQLGRDSAQLRRITKELQRTAMSLRMVPIQSTFQKMNRLVRDIAAKVGKQVELVMEGSETELDRTIVEEISDPLIHMVRNSIDHGIEKPEVRTARGKPAQGTVWLRAFYQGGNIVIQIKDDGNGLNKDRILAKAVEKGLVAPGAQLSENEIFNLIFAPGFSTAEAVTDLSGRGVGMDVVRRNIDKLRGKVEIQSTPGQGSTFSIYLPLTLAIIDGLIVGVGEHRYILPTLSICESFRPKESMLSSVCERGEMLNVRGRLRPLLRLHEHLGVTPATTDLTQSIAVVVEFGNSARCVIVDQLLGKQEVVIKSLGETFKGNSILAGAAILSDGRVGLILDPQSLVQLEPNSAPVAA